MVGALSLVGIAVAYHFLSEKSVADGGEDDVADMDAEIEEIGAIERDQQGMIKWD